MRSMDRGRARAACQQTGREGNEEETRYCAVVAAKATRTVSGGSTHNLLTDGLRFPG